MVVVHDQPMYDTSDISAKPLTGNQMEMPKKCLWCLSAVPVPIEDSITEQIEIDESG